MSVDCAVRDVLAPLPAQSVAIDGVLGRHLRLSIENRLKKIVYSHLVDPFRFRNESDGRWRCEFWGKIVRSTILSWRQTGDADLRKIVDDTVRDLISTQTPDGCISSYPYELQIQDWDIWGRKYVLIGLSRYYLEVDPDPAVKNALVRELDYLMTQVGPGIKRIIDCGWHDGLAASSLLEPVVLVYRISGEKRFLDFAEWIAGQGGSTVNNIFKAILAGVAPEHLGNGKSYEMMSCFEGLAELYRTIGGGERLAAVEALYRAVRDREIFVTGVGGLKDEWGEFWFDGKYRQTRFDGGGLGETCVTTTWVKLCGQVLRLTGDSSVADELERTFYNGILGAMKPDGSWWTHVNPTPLAGPAVKSPAGDQLPGYGEDCCLAQGPTAIGLASYYAAMAHAEGPVINLYDDGKIAFATPSGSKAALTVSGGFPKQGKVAVEVAMAAAEKFVLRLRIPAWSAKTAVRVNGAAVPCRAGEYLAIDREWRSGDRVEIDFDMRIRIQPAFDGGDRIAVLYGPLVLVQDSRLGGVDVPVKPIGGAPVEPPEGIYFAWRFDDGSVLCDYASAGNRFAADNTLCVWLKQG